MINDANVTATDRTGWGAGVELQLPDRDRIALRPYEPVRTAAAVNTDVIHRASAPTLAWNGSASEPLNQTGLLGAQLQHGP